MIIVIYNENNNNNNNYNTNKKMPMVNETCVLERNSTELLIKVNIREFQNGNKIYKKKYIFYYFQLETCNNAVRHIIEH